MGLGGSAEKGRKWPDHANGQSASFYKDDLFLQRRTFGGVDRTWSDGEFERMKACALACGRVDYVSVLYLARYAGLRVHECFRIDTAIAAKAVKESALTIKGKGGFGQCR